MRTISVTKKRVFKSIELAKSHMLQILKTDFLNLVALCKWQIVLAVAEFFRWGEPRPPHIPTRDSLANSIVSLYITLLITYLGWCMGCCCFSKLLKDFFQCSLHVDGEKVNHRFQMFALFYKKNLTLIRTQLSKQLNGSA